MENKSSEEIEKPLNKYIRERHTQEECIGFIDGFAAAESEINKLKEEIKRKDQLIIKLYEDLNGGYVIGKFEDWAKENNIEL